MAARSESSTQAKRSRSSSEASGATSDGPPQKASKLDSAASTLDSVTPRSPRSLTSLQNLPKVSCTSVDADSAVKDFASSAANDVQDVSPRTDAITADTSLARRIVAIEAHHPPYGQSKSAFQQFVDLPFSSAVRFELKRSTRMTKNELTACFNLISSTSQKDYEASCIGWNPEEKMKEMSHTDMMYLLVRQAEEYIDLDKASQECSTASPPDAILGFLSFKLEPEEEELNMMRPVAYIYEIHLDNQLRNQGLGARLIKWVENQARLVCISKIMLTVFAVNKGARRMYERHGFVRDPLTPEDKITRRRTIEPDYIIMSKEI